MNYKKALEIAIKYHKGQKRNKSGFDYITHPIAVANKFKNEEYKIIAVLHDVIEDTEMTIEMLKNFGFSIIITKTIDLLTKKKNQDYIDYLIDIKKNKIATAIKIEDIKHNLSDLGKGNMKDKYLLALYILK